MYRIQIKGGALDSEFELLEAFGNYVNHLRLAVPIIAG
jgi:hypothetical protein